VGVAISAIHDASSRIDRLRYEGFPMPGSLAGVGLGNLLDPWGNPYVYLNLEGAPPGAARKDRFLVPINSDYDLYSMGPDGKTTAPLTAKAARDDIIRANDGAYVGPAAGY
jgi:general secretion pathway protein G